VVVVYYCLLSIWLSESRGAMEAADKADSLASEHMFGLTRREVSTLLLEMVLHVGFWFINCHLYYPALVSSEELKTAFRVSDVACSCCPILVHRSSRGRIFSRTSPGRGAHTHTWRAWASILPSERGRTCTPCLACALWQRSACAWCVHTAGDSCRLVPSANFTSSHCGACPLHTSAGYAEGDG
jgi:hypothetical protein